MNLQQTAILAVALVVIAVIASGTIIAVQAISNHRDPGGPDRRPVQVNGTQVSILADSGINSYDPNPVRISLGETVVWTNYDSARHTATSGEAGISDGAFDSDIMRNGDSFSFTFDEEGEYPYFCLLHPSMVGTILVSDE